MGCLKMEYRDHIKFSHLSLMLHDLQIISNENNKKKKKKKIKKKFFF